MESITALIDQIIQDLINPERKLKDVFLKVKFLAFKLENQKLQDWAGKEINGYISGDQIPEYRTIPTAIYGNLIQDLGVRTIYRRNEPLIIDCLPDEIRKELTKIQFDGSISAIEHLLSNGKDFHAFSIPYYMQIEITKTLTNYWHVESAWRLIASSYFDGVLNAIKSHLLDFLMHLNKEVGENDISIMKDNKKVDDLFRTTIGLIQGGNNTFNFGNNNQSLNTGEIKESTITQNQNTNLTPETLEEIRDLIGKIKADFEQYVQDDYKEPIATQIQVIENQLDKPSPIKSVVNSALKVVYELMIEAAGSAYSPIILEQLRRLFG